MNSAEIFIPAAALSLGAVMVIGNCLTIASVLVFPKLRTLANMYIVSLAATDATVGVLQAFVAAYYIPSGRLWFDTTEVVCTAFFSWGYSSVVCSGLNMCLIALDRYLYIVKPFLYQRVSSRKIIALGISATWLLAFSYGTIPLYYNSFRTTGRTCSIPLVIPVVIKSFASTAIFFFCCTSTAILYAKISVLTLKHTRAIANFTASHAAVQWQWQNDRAFSKNSLKALKLFIVVFGILVAFWTPYFTIEFISAFYDIPGYSQAYKATLFLGFCNSGVNVFVYPYFQAEFRKAYRRLLCFYCDQANIG